MKKLFNKKFILILGSTITLLVVLAVAMIFLTKENIKTFSRSGYIIASSKENSEKYYFDEGTSYKKNINSELVFTNTSGEKVNVETNNFLHYIDGGIKFLKNGVIMDLDSVGQSIVPYYNITNKSLLEYADKSYYIETIDKTLAFDNLIGRISDNKYIVAGADIKLQLAGNDKEITGDYFEITFIEDGIIKVENQEVSYQTTAENSFVLVGDDIRIDLGLKKIYHNNEEKMSLTQMTIDGNENIEIIPNEEEKPTPDSGNGGTGNNQDNIPGENTPGQDGNAGGGGAGGDGTGEGDGDGSGSGGAGGDGTGEGDGSGSGGAGGDGTGEGSGGSGSVERRANIEIVSAEVGVNSINAKFFINDPNGAIKGDLVIYITNTDTGERVYGAEIDKSKKEFNLGVSTLSPESNYIISINEEVNGKYDTQYLQKLFRTDNSGISLEKKYVTSDSVAYEVIFEEDSLIKSAKVRIKDKDYKDIEGQEVQTATRENNIIVFEGLTNNTSYNIILDNIILNNIEYNEKYSIYRTTKTLKKPPYLSGLNTETNEEENIFTIGFDNVVDEDSSITKYSYYIYNADELNFDNRDTIKPVKIITKTDATKVKVPIDGEEIQPKVNYKFKVVAEYYDNEKYSEYETSLSESFILAVRPSVKWKMDFNNSGFNKISGTVVIIDNNCTVPTPDKTCSSIPNYQNSFKMIYYDKDEPNKPTIVNGLDFKNVIDEEFNKENGLKIDAGTLQKYIVAESLRANATYVFEVYGDVDLLDGKGIRKGFQIGTFEVSTTNMELLTVTDWTQNETGIEDLINVSARITSKNDNEALASSLKHLTFNIYAGPKNSISGKEPIYTKTVHGNLKDIYYQNFFTINLKDTFGVVDTDEGRAIDTLKAKTGGKLSEKYTIVITDGWDENYQNKIELEKNVFEFVTPPAILIEENEISPTITATEIYNSDLQLVDENEQKIYEKEYDEKIYDTTIVGYKVNTKVDLDILNRYFSDVKELIYYVCDADLAKGCTPDNAVVKEIINLKETTDTEKIFYLENGTPYEQNDTKLTRGHNYVFKVKFNVTYNRKIDDNNTKELEILYPQTIVETEVKSAPKQGATYSIYIDKTTETEVNYKYSFDDIDNTLYDNKFYYSVNEGEVKTFDFSDSDFVINNLTSDSVYDIVFKRALIKTKSSIEDITVGKYIFDGKYTISKDTVNFENIVYENDNRLRVLILENELNQNLVNRISAYQITLSAKDVKDYTKVYPTDKMSTCTQDEKSYKCIVIDYVNIKEFKAKDINVKITAFYDSGIINNEFEKLSTSELGYILQTNNIYNPDKIRANYINLTDGNGLKVDKIPAGIFEYSGNSKTKLQLSRKIDIKKFEFSSIYAKDIFLTYANDGIYTKDSGGNLISVNNKLLSKVDLGSSDSTFRFDSYIPKVAVNSKGLVNGANVTITPTGIDDEILKNEFKKESDGKYYYYLEIYDNEDNFLREEKLELTSTASTIQLTKYLPDTTYKFKVYAYMLQNKNYVKNYLFTANNMSAYEISTYSFKSLAAVDIGYNQNKSIYTVHESTSENNSNEEFVYATRKLKLTYNTNKNIGDFDVKYEVYDIDGNLVYEEIVDRDSAVTSGKSYDIYERVIDITNDNFIFGNGYYSLKIYTLTEQYDNTEKYVYEVYNNKINIPTVKAPTITIERTNQGVNDLKFRVTVTDNDKVIKDGTYCVQLQSSSGETLSDHPEVCGLSVLNDINKLFEYDNLTSDTTYIFKVSTDIYRNNMGLSEEEKEQDEPDGIKVDILSTSTDYGVSLGSFAAYSNSTGTSVTLSFSSGYNVTNIKQIDFTIMETSGTKIFNENYVMGEDKNFIEDGNNVKVVIEPDLLKTSPLQKSKSYYAVVNFWVEKDGQLVRLNDKSYNPGIEF